MRLLWLPLLSHCLNTDVVVRYFRIQGSTNPIFKEVYSHTAGKVVSSFVPDPILQDTLYEFVTDNTNEVSRLDPSKISNLNISNLEKRVGKQLNYFVHHLVIPTISHEISDCIHHTLK